MEQGLDWHGRPDFPAGESKKSLARTECALCGDRIASLLLSYDKTMERMAGEIDRMHIGRRFSRASATYDEAAIAQRHIAARLADDLVQYRKESSFSPGRALEIGCGTGLLTRHLLRLYPDALWTLNDIQSAGAEKALGYCPKGTEFICKDAETLEGDNHYSLIASASTFQWLAEPSQFVRKLAAWQSAGDVLLFSTFLADTLKEIRDLTGQGLHYPAMEQWRDWLAQDYHIHAMEQERLTLSFDSPLEVLQHLKQTGVTATQNGVWTRGKLRSFCEAYRCFYQNERNQVIITYQPLYVLAIKK